MQTVKQIKNILVGIIILFYLTKYILYVTMKHIKNSKITTKIYNFIVYPTISAEQTNITQKFHLLLQNE